MRVWKMWCEKGDKTAKVRNKARIMKRLKYENKNW